MILSWFLVKGEEAPFPNAFMAETFTRRLTCLWKEA